VTRARLGVWALAAVLVIAVARQTAYALAGGALAERLAGQGGGTDPVWIAAAALTAVGLGALAGLWLVAVGVRERCRLELERWAAAPAPLRPSAVAARALALAVATNLGFALFESTVHYHEGLGWMGLRCIEGPIHADAAPILIGLSLVAAAAVSAVDHVLGALRRVVALRVLARAAKARGPEPRGPRRSPPAVRRRLGPGANPTRGPPVVA
jgi:hypothetical protein